MRQALSKVVFKRISASDSLGTTIKLALANEALALRRASCLPQFAPERRALSAFSRGAPGFQAQIALELVHPVESVWAHSNISRKSSSSQSSGAVVMLLSQHHPNRSFLELRRTT